VRFNKGQALIEFVLILPILLLLILGIIDFGSIIYEKTRLENIMSEAVTLVNDKKLPVSDVEKKLEQNYNINLTLTINHRVDDTKIILKRKIDIMTPGLGIAIDDPYTVEVTRVINNE
jgi:lipopolysaccharide/colanic/teichoic acid biosynthesis glycosyltransferase